MTPRNIGKSPMRKWLQRGACGIGIAVGLTFAAPAATAGPISALYLTHENRVAVFQGSGVVNSFSTLSQNELAIAVDGTVRTMGFQDSSFPTGHEYTLSGTPTGNTYSNSVGYGFFDGTTDGTSNYAMRYDGGDVYQFNLDWTNPVVLFSTGIQDGLGSTYDPTDNSLWLLQFADSSGSTRIEHRTMSGGLLGSFQTGYNETTGLALDHADDTLWLWQHDGAGISQLRQYSKAGALLSSAAYGGNTDNFVYGGEFALDTTPIPEPASLALLASGLAGLAASRRRKHRRTRHP